MLNSFFDHYLEEMDEDELRTVFFTASQTAGAFEHIPSFEEFPKQDAHAMALGLAVALEVIRRYENFRAT